MRATWILITAILGLASVLASPASGAVATVRDPAGDAKPRWDFTRLNVSNGDRSLQITIHYRGPLRTSTGFLTNVGIDLGSSSSEYKPDFTADMLLNSSEGPDRHQLLRGTHRFRCRGFSIKARPARGVVRIAVPQRCFGAKAGRVRITAYSYQVRGAANEADYMDGFSRWIARG